MVMETQQYLDQLAQNSERLADAAAAAGTGADVPSCPGWTVTDLLEALVGHLPASASEAAGQFVVRADGSWLVDGGVSMEEAGEKLDLPELPPEEAGAYHTLGGFVMARLGRIPTAADRVDWGGLRFEVVDMDGRRVDRVRYTPSPTDATEGGDER